MTQLKFQKMGSKIDRGVSFIVYGNPGVGKTTLATTLPAEETLIINSEAGLGPLLGSNHIVFNLLDAIENYEMEKTVDEIYAYLRTEKHPFKYVVLDNISEMEQQLILCLCSRRKKDTPELREYGDSAFKLQQWVHLFRDLVFQGITVIINAWEFPLELKHTDGMVVTQIFPMIGKKIAPKVCGIVDVVAHLEVYEKTGKRWLRIGPHEQYITKSQFKGLETGEIADFPILLQKLYAYDYHQEETIVKKDKKDKKPS